MAIASSTIALPMRAKAPYAEEQSEPRRSVMEDPVLVLKDARLTLDGNAGAVDILHGISLTVRAAKRSL
jgi:hypothetical protein